MANLTPQEPSAWSDWIVIWPGLKKEILTWPVPPGWTWDDWREELRAEGAAAVCQARRDYDSTRGTLWAAFARQRALATMWSRCRREWSYGKRRRPEPDLEAVEPETDGSVHDIPRIDALHDALARLPDDDRWLIEHLFFDRWTEARIAEKLRASRSTISRRKQRILLRLRSFLGDRGD